MRRNTKKRKMYGFWETVFIFKFLELLENKKEKLISTKTNITEQLSILLKLQFLLKNIST